MAELDADHRRMLAERLNRQQAMSPQQLGKMYGDRLKPNLSAEMPDGMQAVAYYFGTDIPIPERNTDSTGQYVIPRRSSHDRRTTAGRDVAIVAGAAIIGVVLLAIIL